MKRGRGVQLEIVPLKSGRFLIASYSLTKHDSRDWAVYLPESGAGFLYANRSELIELVGTEAARKLNFLIINKPGLYPWGIDKDEFERSFLRQRRIEDAIAALKAIVPEEDKIHLIGYSEGAYLAPQVARLDSRVKSITMIGGGTRGWLKEELNNAKKREKPIFVRKIKEICANPTLDRRWNGFTYATWYSYRGDSTLRALKQIRTPTLAIVGARDRVIDAKSAIADFTRMSEQKPLKLHVLSDCGHQFTKHWKPVRRLVSRFFAEQQLLN